MKQLMASITEEQLTWIKQAAKGQKFNVSEFIRAVLDYARNIEPKEITARLARLRLESEMAEAENKIIEAQKHKEHIKKELEKVGA